MLVPVDIRMLPPEQPDARGTAHPHRRPAWATSHLPGQLEFAQLWTDSGKFCGWDEQR